ncbi:MAG: hypothetical protein GY805_15895 [Chloroflexi bacterium]|nr:hypothetical protein [Chloroflexota bacterium]
MKANLLWKQILIGSLLFAFLIGCATVTSEVPSPEATPASALPTNSTIPPTDTPVPPTLNSIAIALTQQALGEDEVAPLPTTTLEPASCGEVNGICLQITFDGETCSYEGPTDVQPGWVTFLFINAHDGNIAASLWLLLEEKTLQDVMDKMGEGSIANHAPSWMFHIDEGNIFSGPNERHTWKGVLRPGIYAMTCAQEMPLSAWYGGGFTVEE